MKPCGKAQRGAYRAGQRAYSNGLPITANPYRANAIRMTRRGPKCPTWERSFHNAWRAGFFAARKAKRTNCQQPLLEESAT